MHTLVRSWKGTGGEAAALERRRQAGGGGWRRVEAVAPVGVVRRIVR